MLTLSPILAVIAGMTFVVKAGMLSGSFYVSAAALFLTAVPMALWPEYGPLMFGLVSAVCFFVPGLKYHRQRLRGLRERSRPTFSTRPAVGERPSNRKQEARARGSAPESPRQRNQHLPVHRREGEGW